VANQIAKSMSKLNLVSTREDETVESCGEKMTMMIDSVKIGWSNGILVGYKIGVSYCLRTVQVIITCL
jgi:hypothetical protein